MLIVWAGGWGWGVLYSAVCIWFSKHMNMSHFFPKLILLLWIWRHKIPNKCWYLSIYYLLTNWQYCYIQYTHFAIVCYCKQWRHLHCDETACPCMVILSKWVFDYIKSDWKFISQESTLKPGFYIPEVTLFNERKIKETKTYIAFEIKYTKLIPP
jgi:hypothetical protein